MALPYKTLNVFNASPGVSGQGGLPMLNSAGLLDVSFFNGIAASSGVASKGAVPLLNPNGVLDPSFFQGIVKSLGAANAGNVPLLNSNGQLDPSFIASTSASSYLQVGSTVLMGGQMTLPPPTGGNYGTSGTFTFPVPLSAVLSVSVQYAAAGGVTALVGFPVFGVGSVTGNSLIVTAEPDDGSPINTSVPIYVMVMGTHA